MTDDKVVLTASTSRDIAGLEAIVSTRKPSTASASPSRSALSLLRLATVAVLLTIWFTVTALHLLPPLFLPSPQAVAASLRRVWTEGFVDATLAQHLTASLTRIFSALFAAVLVAVPIGLLAGVNPYARAIIDPVVEFIRPIPPLAYLPLIIIWSGIGETSKILVLWIAIFPAILLSAAAGVKTVAQERIDAARSLGATPFQVLRFVIFPSALPSILTGIGIGLGGGWSTLVAAELIAATRGLGFMIQSAAQFLVTDVVIMGIFVVAATAFLFEGFVRLAQRLLVPWQGKL
jgi:taurine transport system permease protein